MYDRTIEGKPLTFGVSGKLHANSLIMYDHQTDSLWSHLAGAAVAGPMEGQKLNARESLFTNWGRWRHLYPETKVLNNGRPTFFALEDHYASYYRSPDTGVVPTRRSDTRVYPKEFVLGLVRNGKALAYPFSQLSQKPVLNDVFEGMPILVVFDPDSATGVVFKRTLRDQTLAFKRAKAGRDRYLLIDEATGSVWEGLTGRAIKGKLQGKRLEAVPVTPSFWFGWVDHYPDTRLYTTNESS